ncbi:LysR family transcriptional regulator [Pseudomonas caspiana]|uniref:LysR family transcriptional regulator n=1 Tax=Pseudomonas caspiana TaxID=1451454 RepID=A0A1Y3P5F9_9PSED|nr:LysR family transcriptional regulator [Pseudomonas caspiana]OUM73761.1 LysR family transcriptional regulator [Pseudomonas caspiana]
MIDLNDVAIFIQVVDAGSIAGAARRIGAPSNTLSRRIKQLEENLGARLLHRSTRKLTLTDAGKSLYEQSAAQITQLIEISSELLNGSQEPAGRVRVAAPADFFELFDMNFVADFLARYPRVQLDFLLGDQRNDLIAEGIDLAFRAGAMPDSSLVARKVKTGRRLLAASPAYLAARGVPQDIHALGHHDCVCFPHPSGQTSWNLASATGPARVDIVGRLCASTAQAQLKATLAGLGICFLPESVLRQSLKSGRLVEVLPDYGQQNNDLFIVFPSRKQIPLAVSTFVDEAVAHLQQVLSA